MQADRTIKELEAFSRGAWEQTVAKALSEQPFAALDLLVEVIAAAGRDWIVSRQKSQSITMLLTEQKALNSLLSEADLHYAGLFRACGLFDKQNETREVRTPFSRVFKALYNRLSGRNGRYHSELVIYDVFARWLSSAVAEKLIATGELKKLTHWKRLRLLMVRTWQLPPDWTRLVGRQELIAELPAFGFVKPGLKLEQLAWVANTRKRNRPQVQAYETLWKDRKDQPTLENARILCDGGDYIHFIGDRYFELELLESAGAEHWLRYVDGLQYPILQDHSFIFARNVFFYADLAGVLREMETITSKVFLLYTILENFLQLLRSTGFELKRLKNQLDVDVSGAEDRWWGKTVPAAIAAITEAFLPGGRLEDDLGVTFFRWFSCQVFREAEIGKLFDQTVQAQFDLHIENSIYLLGHTSGAEYNWKCLQISQSTPFGERGDEKVCGSLINLHLDYLRSKAFSWNHTNNFNNETTNQAYHFSVLLVGAGRDMLYWEVLYQEFRIYHEGWDYRYIADYEPERREAYLFCVGIGMAYHLVKEGREQDGLGMMEKLLDKVLAQDRRKTRYDTAYLVPLSFLLVSYLHHFPQRLSAAVIKMTAKIDNLKLFLNVVGGLMDEDLAACLDPTARAIVRKRIDDEFFVVEEQADEPVLRMLKQEYEKLRDRVLSRT